MNFAFIHIYGKDTFMGEKLAYSIRHFHPNSNIIQITDLDADAVAELFGTTSGFKSSDPNVTPTTNETEEEEDF